MQHYFDIELAERFGILEAILLNNFQFWFAKNKANGQGYRDGRYWTYNSVKAFNELFPYASEKKIRTALKHLIDEGILMTGNYNKSAYDRTLWYAFTDYGISICPFGKMEIAEQENGVPKKGEPIPDNNTNNNSYIDTDNIEQETKDDFVGVEGKFREFVDSYPKPVNEYEAYRAWVSLNMNADLYAKLMAGLSDWKKSEQWTKNNGQYITNAITFLRERRWETRPPQEQKPVQQKKVSTIDHHVANYDSQAYRNRANSAENYVYKKRNS